MGGVLERGLAALEAGDLPTAVVALTEVADAGPAPLVNRLLGGLAYMDGVLDGTRMRWERAFRELRAEDDRRGAARVAADLADLHTTSLGNRAAGAGWVQRAQRLLQPVGRRVEHGYLALTVVACEAPDVGRLLEGAELALELAEAFGDVELQVRALADSGYALVVQGRLAEGFGRLDEAMAALSAGEVRDPGVAGTSYCALLSACDRAGDLRRAEEWSRMIEETFLAPLQGRLAALHHHCRLAYGSVLCISRTPATSWRRTMTDRPQQDRWPGCTCCSASTTSPPPSCGAASTPSPGTGCASVHCSACSWRSSWRGRPRRRPCRRSTAAGPRRRDGGAVAPRRGDAGRGSRRPRCRRVPAGTGQPR